MRTEGAIEPDWGMVISNQLTEIAQNSTIIEHQLALIAETKKIVILWDQITARQSTMVDAIKILSSEIDKARSEMRSQLMSIVQVPITVIIIAGASWLFYLKYIEEYTWIVIMAVAAFRYLSDSITGVLKLIGLRHGNGKP